MVQSYLPFLYLGDLLSQESVEWVIGKIILDARFREVLLADPDQVLSAFDLTEREKAGFKCLDSETMEAVAKTLVDRLQQTNPAARGFLLDFQTKQVLT
jgi:hypothetical protein